MPIYEKTYPKITKKTFSFPEFVSAGKNISSIHRFILEIQQILESQNLKGHLHFWPHPPKIIKVTFSFFEFV